MVACVQALAVALGNPAPAASSISPSALASFFGPQSETTAQVKQDVQLLPTPELCGGYPGKPWLAQHYTVFPASNGPFDVYKYGFATYTYPDGYVGTTATTIEICLLNPGTSVVAGAVVLATESSLNPCGH
jgi:hypothetical protein